MKNTKVVDLNKFRVVKTRTNKVLEMLREYTNKEIELNHFIDNSNFSIFKETSKTIDKTKEQYSKELNPNVVALIAYLKNLNNSHNTFYNGFKLSLGYNEKFKLNGLDEFEEVGINCVVVEYREDKDKNKTKGVENE